MIMSFHLSLELVTQFSHHIRYCRHSFWGAFVVIVWALGRMGREKKERFYSLLFSLLFLPIVPFVVEERVSRKPATHFN